MVGLDEEAGTRSATELCHLVIGDEEDTPQRYPLRRLLGNVIDAVTPEQQAWLVSGVWGQGLKTGRLEDAECASTAGEVRARTEDLVDLDDDPNEWFYDVVIRTADRSLTFGIFDSGYMFVEGPRDLVVRVIDGFDDVTEVDFDFEGNPLRPGPDDASGQRPRREQRDWLEFNGVGRWSITDVYAAAHDVEENPAAQEPTRPTGSSVVKERRQAGRLTQRGDWVGRCYGWCRRGIGA